jgi:hypothetical protein
MTAGQNALRASGPGQKPAFENAKEALHYVLFALPTFTSRRMSGAISFTPQTRRVACNPLPLAIMAQAMRAILLASEMAATFVGRRASTP